LCYFTVSYEIGGFNCYTTEHIFNRCNEDIFWCGELNSFVEDCRSSVMDKFPVLYRNGSFVDRILSTAGVYEFDVRSSEKRVCVCVVTKSSSK